MFLGGGSQCFCVFAALSPRRARVSVRYTGARQRVCLRSRLSPPACRYFVFGGLTAAPGAVILLTCSFWFSFFFFLSITALSLSNMRVELRCINESASKSRLCPRFSFLFSPFLKQVHSNAASCVFAADIQPRSSRGLCFSRLVWWKCMLLMAKCNKKKEEEKAVRFLFPPPN